jgi:sugar lactone lactonase YvrE
MNRFPHMRQLTSVPHRAPYKKLPRLLLFILLCLTITSAALWQVGSVAKVRGQFDGWLIPVRKVLRLAIPAQGGVGARTIISTIAGGGFANNAPPREAPMVYPVGTALDPLGRGLYVVDEVDGTSLLRFINTSANPVTLAGVTIPPQQIGLVAGGGAVPELGPARESDLSLVTGIVVDPSGNAVYVSTPLANSIRVINVGTQPFTVLGSTVAPGNIGLVFQVSRPELRALAFNPQTRDFFYVSTRTGNSTTKVIYKLSASSGQEAIFAGGGEPAVGNGDNGIATEAKIVSPLGLVVDNHGNLLIAEGGDARRNPGSVRKVDASGTITSIAARLEFPTGLALAPNGTVYVALGNKQQIVRVEANGTVTPVVGDNSATVCDQFNRPNCGDGGPALSANLTLPSSTDQRNLPFAADTNGVYIPDFAFRRVRFANLSNAAVNVTGLSIAAKQINTIAGNGQEPPYDNIPATTSELQGPTGIAVDAQGNLFIADTTPAPISRLRFVNRGAAPVTLFAGTAWERTILPGHIVTLNDRASIQRSDDRISTASFESPQGLFAVPNGVYIVDSQYGALIKPPNTITGRRSGHIRFLNTSNADVTLFPDNTANRIVVPPGQIKDVAGVNDVPPNSGYGTNGNIGDGGAANRAVLFPTDVVVDAQGNLYIADQGSNRIRIVDGATGVITSFMTPGLDSNVPYTTSGATGLAFDNLGRLLIADTRANRVLRQSVPGGNTFVTITDASKGVSRPRDVVTDAAGNIYVTSSGNNQVLRIVAPDNTLGTVSVIAGNGQRGFGGDGGPANRAKLDFPNPTGSFDIQYTISLLPLADGSLLFTDTNNNRVRMLVPTPNQPPVLAAINNETLNEGQMRTLSFSASDGNGDPLSFTINNKPGFATFTDSGTGAASLQLAPGFTDAGTYQISLTVSDGDATDTKSFTVTVSDVNRPPTVTAQAISSPLEATAPAGRQVTLSGSATDPDNDPISYKWFDGSVQIASTATATVTLGFGQHSIFLMATDARDASASSPAQAVLVQDTTAPIISNVPADITTRATTDQGANVTFTLPAATDVVDGNVPVTADPASGSLFTIGTTTVNFTARDARNNTARASFKITVQPLSGPVPGTNITTFAGTGNYGFTGDGGPAIEATFKEMRTLNRDKDGNLLIVEGQGRVVRRVILTGEGQDLIRTIAGNGANANTGDSNLAVYASFGATGGAASDAQGNFFVSDTNFHRVRRITPEGRIFHFAGSPSGQSGVQGDFGSASAARLSRPTAVVTDAQGNVYIADSGNHRIRRVQAGTNTITTFAGNGAAGFNGDGGPATQAALNNPTGLFFDAAGNLFIADRNNHRIRRIDAATKIITTVAGNGTQGFAGDDDLATNAQLNNPADVAVDAQGHLFIVDQGNHRVRRVNANDRTIKTFAGTGVLGFGGDGGPALQAKFNTPAGITIDAQGNIYVGDHGNLRVRRMGGAATGGGGPTNRAPVITSTLANQTITRGQTVELPLTATDEDGDSVTFTLLNAPAFASLSNANPAQRTATLRLAPTETGTFNNLQVQASDGKGGMATSAAISITVTEPSPNNRPPTASANTLATPLEAASASGAQLSLSGSGNDPDGDPLTFTWFDGNTAIANSPTATVILGLGSHSLRLVVADNRGGTASTPVQTVVVQDTTPPTLSNIPADITTAATSGGGALVTFTLPTATDLVDGNVSVTAEPASGSLFPVGTTTVNFTASDSRSNVARASFRINVTTSGGPGGGVASFNISTLAGNGSYGFSGDGGQAINATLRSTTGLSLDKDGHLLIVDGQSRNVRRVFLQDASQGLIRTAAGNGANANSGDGNQAIYASFGATGGIATDALGNLYVSDSAFHRVRKIGTDGRISHFAGSPMGVVGIQGDFGAATASRLNRPGAIAVDAQGNVFILDMGNNRVRRVDAVTNIITTYVGNGAVGYSGDGGPAINAALNNPTGLALDAQGNLFIADRGNQRIRRVDAATRTIATSAGDGTQGFKGDDGEAGNAQFNNPTDVAVDALGNVYIVDQGNHRLRRMDGASRIIKTIAGAGIIGFDGDGGPALQAKLNLPSSVEVAADGSVFLGDAGNLRVRKLTPSAPPPPPNKAPVITATLGNQTLTRGQTLEAPLAASDADGDSVSFALLNAPSFATIVNANPAQRTATLRLTPTTAGTFDNVQVQAEDTKGGKAVSSAFTIQVNEPAPCLATVSADRWKGEYFSNRLLQGAPVLVRDDGASGLSFNFGQDSPSTACNVPADDFSIRWTRAVNFEAGVYRFTATGDDGFRLYVDDALRIDLWKDQAETTATAEVTLSAGTHALRFEHYDAGGLAVAQLAWRALNRTPVLENIPSQVVARGQVIEVEIRAADADGDPVTFTLENAPAFITLIKANPAQRSATLRIAPPTGDNAALYTLRVNADDGRGGMSASNSFTVTVADNTNNRLPVAVANRLPEMLVAGSNNLATLQLDATASTDPDGDQLSFAWLDHGTVIATSAAAEVQLALGEHLISLRVSDGRGGVTTTPAQKVTVAPAARASLSVSTVLPSVGKRGNTVNITLTGTGFVPGTQVQFSGSGITTTTTFISETQVNVRLTISVTTLASYRNLIINNPGGETFVKANAFAVTP